MLAAGAAVQGGLGLLRRDWYVDDAWVKSTWLGNDIVTLFVIAPLLAASCAGARHQPRGRLTLRTGLIAYCGYNYLFYLLGATLNVFFPLYVALVLLSPFLLARTLFHAGPAGAGPALHVGPAFRPASDEPDRPVFRRATTRAIAAWLIFVGSALGCVWLAIWARHIFLGAPTPVSPDAFRLVAALDLTIITPSLVVTGALLWSDRPWGYFGGGVAAIGATAYLLVLAVNATLAWSVGNAGARNEVFL